MSKYLVLGGSGFIGRKLVDRLSRDNQVSVADLVCSPEFEGMENVSYKYCNFTEEKNFASIINDADTVIHLVSTLFAKDGTIDLETEVSLNVLSTIRLLESMVGRKTKLLFVSSGGTVYGEGSAFPNVEEDAKHAFCGYALTKMMIEDTLELYQHQHGLYYKTVRLSNPYGFITGENRIQGLIPILVGRIMRGEKITIWGDGNNVRDYIFIDDAIDAIEAILDYEGNEQIFNVGKGVGYTICEVLQLIMEKLKPEKEPIIEYCECRKCDIRKNVLNIEKIKKYTAWEPRIGIEEGIDLVINQFKSIIKI